MDPGTPAPEACDGLDNDCNGSTDDGLGLGTACTAGLGACSEAGVYACDGVGGVECDAVPGVPGIESCDLIDDDCDGDTDEDAASDASTWYIGYGGDGYGAGAYTAVGCAAPAGFVADVTDCDDTRGDVNPDGTEVCYEDDVDEDCDGVADDGAGCRLRPNVMLCGNSARDVTEFIPPGSGLVRVDSCTPDANTQALFITRYGTIDTTVLQNYLAAGGNVITEYSISHGVFNQTFGTAVAQPAGRLGSCQDNVMTAVQFGSTDRFWQENVFGAPASTSCGYDLDNLPGITALGGWDVSSVGLAYRDYGRGRLWLVDADWQDNEAAFSVASQDLMRYMVSRVPARYRPNLMRCGNSSRDVSAFIPPGAAMTVVAGCVPDVNTQALIVTREGSVDGATLDAWVEAGGNVITEYSITDDIFNGAFGAAVALGGGFGSCTDNVTPVVQHGAGDPFWQDNAFAGIEIGSSGCGADIDGFPRITPLGGWDANSVSLAYRERGLGRVWLVESDWYDNEASFTDASRDLMRSMVGWSPAPLRPTLMLCGTSWRPVSQLVPPGSNLAVVSSCFPDSDTQALLIARDGDEQVAAADLQRYLAAGGRVLTEWGNSAAVFNAVMDALAPLGVRHLDMPASPERVWQAIQVARTAQ